MTMQSDDFPGYETLRLHFADLMDCPFDPPSVASTLFGAGIVGSQVDYQAKQFIFNEGTRRTNIVSAVQANGAPGVFQSFVEILQKSTSNHAICGKLKATYARLGGVWLDKETGDSRAAPPTATRSVAVDDDETTDESIETPLFELTAEFKKDNKPLSPPSEDSKRQAVKEFATNVKVVIQTCNPPEYYAALEKLKPPLIENQVFTKPVEYFHTDLTIVVGTFAGTNAAVIKTEQGVKCKTDLEAVFENVCTNATWLLGLGVCYGLKKEHDLKFADVLVGKKIKAIETPKFKPDGTMDTRGEDKVTPKSVQKIFCKDPDMWDDFIVCKESSKRIARAFVGLLASASILFDDPRVMQGLKNSTDAYLGGEMEGWAQIEYTPERVKCIIIKGIADFADGTKNKVWQLTAAKAAVDYAHYKLEENKEYLKL